MTPTPVTQARPALANAEISRRVLALIAAGQSPVDALRAVCGADVVTAMISDLYDELHSKAARVFGQPVPWADMTNAEKSYVASAMTPRRDQPTGRVFTIGDVRIQEVEGGR